MRRSIKALHTRAARPWPVRARPRPSAQYFLRSAPAATGSPHEFQTTLHMAPLDTAGANGSDSQATVTASAFPPLPTSPLVRAAAGCNIMVVDLRALLAPSTSALRPEPEVVAQFEFAKVPVLSALQVSEDGMSVAACSKDGHAVCVFQIQPAPCTLRHPPTLPHSREQDAESALARYRVRRASLTS